MELTDKLLALAAATTWDSGEEVVRALRAVLMQAAPFDAGEVALPGAVGFDRWTLTEDEEPVAAEDLLLHVASHGEPFRLDDVPECDRFPRTRELLERRGLRSLLVLPLGVGGGSRGAVVLGRRHGWAFVAASLHVLEPVATMAGLCLERALALTALRRELESLSRRASGGAAQLAEARQDLDTAGRQLAAARQSAEEARARLEEAERRAREIEGRLVEVEGARQSLLGEREGLRSGAARLETALGSARDEIAARREELAAVQRVAEEAQRAAEASIARSRELDSRLQETLTAYRNALAEARRQRAETERLDAERAALLAERDKLRSRLESLRQQAREARPEDPHPRRRRPSASD